MKAKFRIEIQIKSSKKIIQEEAEQQSARMNFATVKISKEATEKLNTIMSIAKSPDFVIPEEEYAAVDQDLYSKYEYQKLENQSKQNYQLQITIHEGKGLKGNNINPFCRLTFNKETKTTEVKKQTNSPFWDKLYVFDVSGEYPDIAKNILSFKVLSENGPFRRNTILGIYKIDFNTIFNNTDHQFIKKWIRLFSPIDRAQKNEPQLCGFLLISLTIITSGNMNYEIITIGEKVKSGILLPDTFPRNRLKIAMRVTVHSGQDLNKGISNVLTNQNLESINKSLNPYVVVRYAGSYMKTSVKSNQCNPIWNESVVFYDIFPPMSRFITIQVYDNNVFGSEIISTINFDICSIMSSGSCEYLPTFGPTWLNLYGNISNDSRFSKSTYMNENSIIGYIYHGRILLSITSYFSDVYIDLANQKLPLETVDPLLEDFEGKSLDFMITFLIFNVNMIPKAFQGMNAKILISCGSNGTFSDLILKEDKSFSTENMIIKCEEGAKFAYLDINSDKPCCSIRFSSALHIFRLYQKNLLLKIYKNLNIAIIGASSMINEKIEDLPDAIIKAIFELIVGCQRFIKNFSIFRKVTYGYKNTPLDQQLHLRRVTELTTISKECCNIVESNKIFEDALLVFTKLKEFRKRVFLLNQDPQDSVPDIFIWLIIKNIKIAVARINPWNIIHSSNPYEMGIDCGEIKYFFMKHSEEKLPNYNYWKNYGIIEGIMWFGLEKNKRDFVSRITHDVAKDTAKELLSNITNIINFPFSIKLTLRAHIYLAVDVKATDPSGSSDPFVCVYFLKHNASTIVKMETLCPVWSQTLFITDIEYFGILSKFKADPPYITVKLFDMDEDNSVTEIGTNMVKPTFKPADEEYKEPNFPPKLQWTNLYGDNEITAKLLCCLELLEHNQNEEVSFLPKDFENMRRANESSQVIPIPTAIIPEMSSYRFEIFLFGIRSLVAQSGLDMGNIKYIIEFECGQFKLKSSILDDVKNRQNFKLQYQYFDVELPIDENKRPSLSIRILSIKSFNRVLLRGLYTFSTMKNLYCKKKTMGAIQGNDLIYIGEPPEGLQDEDLVPESTEEKETGGEEEKADPQLEWWLNYYDTKIEMEESGENVNYINDETLTFNKYFSILKKRPVKIFKTELENVPPFKEFSDVFETRILNKGSDSTKNNESSESLMVAKFKGKIKLWSFPLASDIRDNPTGTFTNLPTLEPIKVHLRVYIVKANDLHPSDASGEADPYVTLEIGSKIIKSKDPAIRKNLNPYFGQTHMFEIEFPKDYLLKVKIFDFDDFGTDDLIGQTEIDLENRFHSRHLATMPLPTEYTQYGAWKWRHSVEPSQILQSIATQHGFDPPILKNGSCQLGNYVFFASPMMLDTTGAKVPSNEPAALKALQNLHMVPQIGYHFVPEHIETRQLYNPKNPGIPQGTLEMFLEMYAIDNIPTSPPLNIKPIVPDKFELRIVVLNTSEIPLDDADILTGEKSVDIYVKGWIEGLNDDYQKTDVHKKSLNGDGNFNWRFIFRFDYHKAERKFVQLKKDNPFGPVSTVMAKPVVHFQVYDQDLISSDDFLGALELNLLKMPMGARSPKTCNLDTLKSDNTISLFEAKTIRGWYPFGATDEFDMVVDAGKVELEFKLVSLEEAENNPVGKAREEPDALLAPNRPDNSISWLLYPITMIIHLLWIPYKDCILKFFVMILMIAILGLVLYTLPSSITGKIV